MRGPDVFGKAGLVLRTLWGFALVEFLLRTRPLPRAARHLGLRLGSENEADDAVPVALTASQAVQVRRVLRLVARIDRVWFRDITCLRKTLVSGLLLPTVRPAVILGVRRDDDGQLAMHAWLEVADVSLDPTSERYTALRTAE